MPIWLSKRLGGVMWKCIAPLILAAPLLAAPLPAAPLRTRRIPAPAPTAESLFVKVLQADDLFSYQGRQITTYWRVGRTTEVRVFHRPLDSRRISYLNPESQRGRLLVSDGRQQWQFDPRRRELRHRRLSPGALDNDDLLSYALLRANYLLDVQPQPRTWADRRVYLVTIKHPSGHTLARRFWVDAGSGLILKRETYRDDGKLAVTVAFTDIAYRPAPAAAGFFNLSALAKRRGVRVIETPSPREMPLPLSSVRSQLGGRAYVPATLSGYRLVGASSTRVGRKTLLHLRYSDGLNLVSLFEQPRTQPRRPTLVRGMRATRIGPVAGYVSHRASLTTLNWDTATLNVTLIGELGAVTMRGLALTAVGGK